MKLEFKHLRIKNFLSFAEAELDLSDAGYVLVSGINQNPVDNAKSNGSGKSSIWEAISWVLTGTTIRGGSSDIRNIYTTTGAFVELTFDADDKHYKVLRSKEDNVYKTNLKIWINDEDKSGKGIKDSEKLLKEYLPELTSSLLGSVIILGQGLPQRFSNNTPVGRKEVLEKLSKSDFMIEDLKERVTKRSQELSLKVRNLQDEKLKKETELSVYTRQHQELSAQLEILTQQLSELSESDKKCEELKLKIEEQTIETEHLSQFEAEQREITESLRKQLTELSEKETSQVLSIQKEYSVSLRDLQDKLSLLSADISSRAREIQRLDNISDKCPTCGQKLLNIVKPDTTVQKTELAKLEVEKETVRQLKELKLKEQDTDIKEKRAEYYSQRENVSVQIEDSKRKINEYSSQLSLISSSLSTASRLLDKLSSDKENILIKQKSIQEEIKSKDTLLDNTKEKILYLIDELEQQSKHVAVISKFNTLITRDFRGFLLTNIINYIDSRAKEYSKKVFDTTAIEFNLNGNNIDILYNGKLYEDLSGGEKQKIDIIVQLSIRDMLCRYNNFSSNILVIDEAFDNLDSIGCQKILDLISETVADISSIYIVTHHTDIDIPYDHEIVVVKNIEGISTIK